MEGFRSFYRGTSREVRTIVRKKGSGKNMLRCTFTVYFRLFPLNAPLVMGLISSEDHISASLRSVKSRNKTVK